MKITIFLPSDHLEIVQTFSFIKSLHSSKPEVKIVLLLEEGKLPIVDFLDVPHLHITFKSSELNYLDLFRWSKKQNDIWRSDIFINLSEKSSINFLGWFTECKVKFGPRKIFLDKLFLNHIIENQSLEFVTEEKYKNVLEDIRIESKDDVKEKNLISTKKEMGAAFVLKDINDFKQNLQLIEETIHLFNGSCVRIHILEAIPGTVQELQDFLKKHKSIPVKFGFKVVPDASEIQREINSTELLVTSIEWMSAVRSHYALPVVLINSNDISLKVKNTDKFFQILSSNVQSDKVHMSGILKGEGSVGDYLDTILILLDNKKGEAEELPLDTEQIQ